MTWKDLLEKAYVPYSKIPNACIIQGHKGDYFSGVRIENVSFPLTITAFQAACCICLAYRQRPITIFLYYRFFVISSSVFSRVLIFL